MRTMRSVAAALLLLCAAPTLAVDGVREINAVCAVNTGCFGGDTAGYPVTITTAGSYRLTGNLTFTDATGRDIVSGETCTSTSTASRSADHPVFPGLFPTAAGAASSEARLRGRGAKRDRLAHVKHRSLRRLPSRIEDMRSTATADSASSRTNFRSPSRLAQRQRRHHTPALAGAATPSASRGASRRGSSPAAERWCAGTPCTRVRGTGSTCRTEASSPEIR